MVRLCQAHGAGVLAVSVVCSHTGVELHSCSQLFKQQHQSFNNSCRSCIQPLWAHIPPLLPALPYWEHTGPEELCRECMHELSGELCWCASHRGCGTCVAPTRVILLQACAAGWSLLIDRPTLHGGRSNLESVRSPGCPVAAAERWPRLLQHLCYAALAKARTGLVGCQIRLPATGCRGLAVQRQVVFAGVLGCVLYVRVCL